MTHNFLKPNILLISLLMSCFSALLIKLTNRNSTQSSFRKGSFPYTCGKKCSLVDVIFCVERGFDCLFCSLFSEVRRRELKHLAELIHSWQRKTNRGARINLVGGRSDTSNVRVLGEVQSDRGCVRQCEKLRQRWGVCACGERSRSERTKTRTHAQEPTETKTAFHQRLKDYSSFRLHPSWGEPPFCCHYKQILYACVFNCCRV